VSGNELASASASASDKPKVLEAVGDVSAQIRKALGDTTVESAGQTAKETFTAASLEAAREYSLAQDLANANRDEEALAHYQKAIALDSGFGRAYSGSATSETKLGRRAAAEQLYKLAFEHADRMTEREKLRTYGSYFLQIAGDNAQAVTTYSELVAKYPADGAGHNGLAIAYFNTRQFQKALAEGSALLKIYPRSVLYRYNYALYAMYAGDFGASEREAQRALELNPNTPKAYLAIAMAALARGNTADAAAAYRKVAATGARGASLASIGLADLALYAGNAEEAQHVLHAGIAADMKSGNAAAVAAKYVALSDAQALTGSTEAAVASVKKAAESSRSISVLLPAAEMFLTAHRAADARKIATELAARMPDYDRAGAKVIEAHLLLDEGRSVDAIASFRDAAKLADLWIVTLHTGIAYYQAGSYPQALAAFEECDRRPGEMTAVFLDDVPTYRYRVTLLYWLGKARAALGQASAAATLKEFLSHRPPSATDAMTVDARRIVEGR
jgi:tetratricopeptide (TPR) repeat protein